MLVKAAVEVKKRGGSIGMEVSEIWHLAGEPKAVLSSKTTLLETESQAGYATGSQRTGNV